MIGRFAGRVRKFPLFPAVCVAVGLAPLAYVATVLTVPGPGAASATASVRPTSPALTERVPASARVLTVTYTPGIGAPSARPQPARPVSVSVTDLARVRQVASLLDRLSLAAPGTEWSCPAFDGGTVKLAFSSPGGRTLAVGDYAVSCPPMDLIIGGTQQAQAPIVSDTFTRQVLRISGIRATAASLFGSAR
jgi:hypothetical protein